MKNIKIKSISCGIQTTTENKLKHIILIHFIYSVLHTLFKLIMFSYIDLTFVKCILKSVFNKIPEGIIPLKLPIKDTVLIFTVQIFKSFIMKNTNNYQTFTDNLNYLL